MIPSHLDTRTVYTMLGLFGLLLAATLIVRGLMLGRPDGDYRELWLRVRTWWLMAGIFALALALSPSVSLVFLAFVSFLALKEYLSLIPSRRADRRVLFWAYLAIPVQFYWVYAEWYGMFIIFIPVYMFLLMPLRMVTIGQTQGFLHAAGTLHWGLMATVFSISHAAFLLVLRPAGASPEAPGAGPGLLLYLVCLTQLNNVAQYCWGKLLGRRKVVPTVSPGKTWAGFLGGVTTTLALATLAAPWLTPMDHRQGFVAGLLLGLGGFCGDVVISAVKRDLGIKDSGSLLPGHGGILDRVDSLTYTAPLFFHYVWWLLPWSA